MSLSGLFGCSLSFAPPDWDGTGMLHPLFWSLSGQLAD